MTPGGAPRDLLIVGAGGFGRETAEAVRALNDRQPTWRLRGFLDDRPDLAGATVDDLPVVGPTATAGRYPEAQLVVSPGSPRDYDVRRQIVDRLALPSSRYATLVHPTAVVARAARLGPGTVLLATAVVTASARVGAHVAIMPGVVLAHDDVIADYVTIAAGARLAGGVIVEQGAYIGAGALIREGCRIGPGALVGMGAVVLTDVGGGEVWAGVPARRLRRRGQAS